MKKISPQQKAALIVCFLIILATASILYLYIQKDSDTSDYTIAQIYQNGILLHTIPLHEVTEEYTLILSGETGYTNEVKVISGSIGVINATCPDLICVKQGFIHTSLIPITCLPNRLVIQIKEKETETPDLTIY